MLEKVYKEARSKFRVCHDMVDVEINRGVRQGCVLSPLLFNAVLEDIFREMEWEAIGINVNGRKLNHLRYADDVVLMGESLEEVQRLLTELDNASKKVGLEISRQKTVAMTSGPAGNLLLGGNPVAYVEHFVYLGQSVSCTAESKELTRRIGAGWGAFNHHRLFLTKRGVPMRLKKRVFQRCVMPSLTYGCETWSLKEVERRKLRAVQRRMERAMLGVTLLDRIRSEEIRRRTTLPDLLDVVWKRKVKWAYKVANLEDDRWSKVSTEWWPRSRKRRRGRPHTRWTDELEKTVEDNGLMGTTWMRLAREDRREFFRILGTAGPH